jgi:hypothetical protein
VLLQIFSALYACQIDVDAFLKEVAQANQKALAKPGSH